MSSIPRRLSLILKIILLLEIIASVWGQQWMTAFVTTAILLVTLTPVVMAKRFALHIPPEFEVLAITFVFASLFLGEVRDYYTQYWWWDIALHTASGLVLGIVGFLLVYLLNETDNINLNMNPGFVAFFAFLFAVGVGAIWEIFEFSMDQLFGMNMQKAMRGDPSGLTDTMWDLIVDTLGAATICILGYSWLKTGKKQSFLERWIASFIEKNPRLFSK